jgi:hypothetical protein
MYAFGIECLDTARFDTDVPLHFFHSIAAIADDMGGDRSVWLRPEVRRDLQRMFDGYEKHAGDRERSRYRSMQAAVAWFLSDWEDARGLLDELGDDVDGRPFTEHFGTDLPLARAQIQAYTGKHGEQLLRAEALSRDGDCDGALSLYRAVLDTSKGDPIVDSYIRERAAILEVERDFATGDWTSLRPSPSLTAWTPDSGEWVVEPDGALRGTRRERSLWIWCDADLGDRLELRGRVEFVEVSGRWADACVALRCPPRPQRDDVILAIKRKLGRLNLSHSFAESETLVEQAEIGDMNTFHVYVWDDEVTVFFNDAPVFTTTTVDQHIGHSKHRIGFGCSRKSHDVVLRFRDLEVRRLPSQPTFEADEREPAEHRRPRRGGR